MPLCDVKPQCPRCLDTGWLIGVGRWIKCDCPAAYFCDEPSQVREGFIDYQGRVHSWPWQVPQLPTHTSNHTESDVPLNKAHLVVKVDGKRPLAVVVMTAQTMLAEVTIEELKRVHDQINRMEDHPHDGAEQENR